MFIVIQGSPFDGGMQVHGPFFNSEDALIFAEHEMTGSPQFEVADLIPPFGHVVTGMQRTTMFVNVKTGSVEQIEDSNEQVILSIPTAALSEHMQDDVNQEDAQSVVTFASMYGHAVINLGTI